MKMIDYDAQRHLYFNFMGFSSKSKKDELYSDENHIQCQFELIR